MKGNEGVRALLVTIASMLLASAPAFADKHKDERGRSESRGAPRGHAHGHGPKIEVRDNGKEYRYEYKDRGCKYEYKLNYRTGEERVQQKGNCRGVSPRRAIYRPEVPVAVPDVDVVSRSPSRLACNREVIGAVLGGVAGGVIGSNVGHGDTRKVATVAGAIIGAVIGSNIGRRMDRADEGCAYQAFEFAAPGETVFWREPTSQIEYSITPARLTRRSDGRECREYQAIVGSGAGAKNTSGVACRRADGAWQIE